MIRLLREAYNAGLPADSYEAFQRSVAERCGERPGFRLAETPLFLPDAFVDKLLGSCERVSAVIAEPQALRNSAAAIQAPYWSVPGALGHPLFLQYDYAICTGPDGEPEPQLIELQGFPSLYAFQRHIAAAYRATMPVPEGYDSYFGLTAEAYVELLRRVILNGHRPSEVVLLDLNPRAQHTFVDFAATERDFGIPTVGLQELRREGRALSYVRDGRVRPVRRIYNRVILDDLLREDLQDFAYTFREDVDVEWAAHPDWFLRISKHTLPALGHLPYVPATRFASDYAADALDLGDYILKPLFSYSGSGVNLRPTPGDIEGLDHPENWILQRRVAYEPILETPTGPARCEIRVMLVWVPGEAVPQPVNNLVRITKGEMTGVKFNRDRDWVGASVGLHRRGMQQ